MKLLVKEVHSVIRQVNFHKFALLFLLNLTLDDVAHFAHNSLLREPNLHQRAILQLAFLLVSFNQCSLYLSHEVDAEVLSKVTHAHWRSALPRRHLLRVLDYKDKLLLSIYDLLRLVSR